MARLGLLVLFGLGLWGWSLAGVALGADKPGCADHPAVSRFAGAELLACKTLDYAEAAFPPANPTGSAQGDKAAAQKAAGTLTALVYHAPAGKTVPEVFLNYRQALQDAGFSILAQREGGYGAVWNVIGQNPARANVQPDRYLYARKDGLAVSVAVGIDQGDRRRVGVDLRVIEEKPLETGQVLVSAANLKQGIASAGKIALYGIYFDTGKADVKPESKPQLAEIAKLLTADPKLSVFVVGHTDNQGTLAVNQDLSKRRAEAVVASLVQEHAVAPARLTAAGVGPLAPVASNSDEAGRAKNRRTEIVAR